MATKPKKDNIESETAVQEDAPTVAGIEASEIESEKEVKHRSFLLWFLAFLLVVTVFGFLGYKFMLGKNDDLEKKADSAEVMVLQDTSTPKAIEVIAPSKDDIEHTDLQFGNDSSVATPDTKVEAQKDLVDNTEKLTKDLEKEIEQDAIIEKKSEEKASEHIAKIEPKIQQLEKQNQNLLMFLSAQNISNAYNAADEEALKRELVFLKKVSGSDAEFQGKVDLVEYSLEGGLTSADALEAELDKMAKAIDNAQEKSFWQNLKDSIFGLVKVTKLDEKAEGDYPKVLLAKNALKKKDFNEAIRLVDAIDKKYSRTWLDKAYKLQRVQETVNYLLEMTRKKLVQ